MTDTPPLGAPRRLGRYACAATGALICSVGFWLAARAGLAQHHIGDPAARTPASLAQAARLNPSDPDIHYAQAGWLHGQRQFAQERQALERVIVLRPRDHMAWLRLGDACRAVGEAEAALRAYRKAITLAPYYAQPRWKLGSLLLRLGHESQGFAEIRRAAASEPARFGEAQELAWEAFAGDAAGVVRALAPQSPREKLMLARFLLKKGAYDESVGLWRPLISELAPADRQELGGLVAELIAAKRFAPAQQVWSVLRSEAGAAPTGGLIENGGFEGRLAFDESGFGWKVVGRSEPKVTVAVDDKQPRAGARSLLISFDGSARTSVVVVSQLVLVRPGARYRLDFAARAEDITTGGPPVVRVREAAGAQVLAESPPAPKKTEGWQTYSVEFSAGAATEAVSISVERLNCSSGPCPIIGRLWLDDFTLQPVEPARESARPVK